MAGYSFDWVDLVHRRSVGSSTAILDGRSYWATGNNKNIFKIILIIHVCI